MNKIADGNYRELIDKGITLVDFYAPWCMPCVRMEKQIEDFFAALRDRRLIRGENISSYKISSQPLSAESSIEKHKGGELPHYSGRKISKSKKHSASSSSSSKSEVSFCVIL